MSKPIPDSVAIRLATASEAMRTPPSPPDKAFLARMFVLATLPHRDPGNVPTWGRKNGHARLTIHPHIDDAGIPRYPFGSIPRLLLYWLVGEAKRTQSRRLELGATLAEFMREVGLNPDTGGGKRGDAARLRDQMERLFRAQIRFEDGGAAATERSRWLNMQVTDYAEVWWSHTAPSQRSLFGSYIVLGEAFYQAVTTGPVPLDRRALRELRRSPFALDLYAWATHRAYRRQFGFVSWAALRAQFGGSYQDTKNFQKAASSALRKIKAVYPALNYQCGQGGVEILPSLPAVPRQEPKEKTGYPR